MSKINRIKELLAERGVLSAQLEDSHRINRSLTATIDMFRAQDENDEPLDGNAVATKYQDQIDKLKDEVHILRDRISRLNNQNFALKEENKKMKLSLITHSKKVLSEHNYNM